MIARVAAALLLSLLPLGAAGWFVRRVRVDRPVSWLLAASLGAGGAAAGLGTFFAERALLRFTELSVEAPSSAAGPGSSSAAALVALFLLIAPLEEAAKALVVSPTLLARRLDGPGLGVTFAVCAASGFAAAETAAFLTSTDVSALRAVRAAAGIPAHAFFAGVWGYALGRRVRSGSRWFGTAWVLSALGHGLYDHIVFGRGPGYLVIALPMLLAMGLVTWSALRDIAPSADSSLHLPLHIPEPPSLRAVRRALGRTDQPLALRWIVLGAFVNVGAVIVTIAAAVFVARRVGIDLSVADEADMRSNGPLVLLGTAVLAAFPLAGYLVARASGARAVLEPALAGLVAMMGAIVILALTAPSAVIFAFAIGPIAFGLSCAGAWFGMDS